MQGREAGQVLGGKYRLVRELGSGGMGAVWHAEHLTLSSPVALKLIEPATAREPDAVQRFLREARTAAALRSPHVVQILDYGVDGDTPYIAMELLEGESLAERLGRLGRLGTHETARVIQHVARAIGRAHDAGIVHRDLKPENVFIVQNDDEEVIKVLDFGIVKTGPGSLGASAGAVATRTGTLLGTPYFMSPEQAEGVKSVDHRTDIWALGVIAFKCLLGRLPFAGDSVGRLILEICSRPLPVPSHVGVVPDGFDAWFARACARDPNDRFVSAKQASVEFIRLDQGDVAEPVAVAPPSLRDEPSEPPLAATTGHSTNSEMAARPKLPRSRRGAVIGVGVAAVVALAALIGSKLSDAGPHPMGAAAHAGAPAMPASKGEAATESPLRPTSGMPNAREVTPRQPPIAAPEPSTPSPDGVTALGADAEQRPPQGKGEVTEAVTVKPRAQAPVRKPTATKARNKPSPSEPAPSSAPRKPAVDLGI